MNQTISQEREHKISAQKSFSYSIKSIIFDENYRPADSTRATTNFANLARGEKREQNLLNTLAMIDSRFNALACWDNDKADRYTLELNIISVDVDVDGKGETFPSIEILKINIYDRKTDKHIEGIVGNNFSSYVRDYDFSIRLPEHNKNQDKFSIPDDFGVLHGKIFQDFLHSDTYQDNFSKPPVICLSVSENKTYQRSNNEHPILGTEYSPDSSSLTEQYFIKMGFKVRYFMPAGSVAPLAFYHFGDLLADYSNLELIGTISTMETFQRIYRPEIYNANATAGHVYRPSLSYQDFSLTQIEYDREERSQLAVKQGAFAEENFITPYKDTLQQWLADCTV